MPPTNISLMAKERPSSLMPVITFEEQGLKQRSATVLNYLLDEGVCDKHEASDSELRLRHGRGPVGCARTELCPLWNRSEHARHRHCISINDFARSHGGKDCGRAAFAANGYVRFNLDQRPLQPVPLRVVYGAKGIRGQLQGYGTQLLRVSACRLPACTHTSTRRRGGRRRRRLGEPQHTALLGWHHTMQYCRVVGRGREQLRQEESRHGRSRWARVISIPKGILFFSGIIPFALDRRQIR